MRRFTSVAALFVLTVMVVGDRVYAQDIYAASTVTIESDYVVAQCFTNVNSNVADNYTGTITSCDTTSPLGTTTGVSPLSDNSAFPQYPADDLAKYHGGPYHTSGVHDLYFDYDPDDDVFLDPLGIALLEGIPGVGEQGQPVRIYAPYEDNDVDINAITLAYTASLEVTTLSVSPSSAVAVAEQTVQFTSSIPARWSVVGSGFITQTGLYTADYVDSAEAVDILACDSNNSQNCDSAVVNVEPATISVEGPLYATYGTESTTFTATVTGSAETVSWSLSPTSGAGTISSSGNTVTYTGPSTLSSPIDVVIKATLLGVTASASLTVYPVSLTVSPMTATLPLGTGTVLFSTITNAPENSPILWTVSGGGGSVSPPDGPETTYTAPATATGTTATVTASLYGTTSKPATISFVPPVVVTPISGSWPSGVTSLQTITGSGFGTAPQVTTSDPRISVASCLANAAGTSVQCFVTIPSLVSSEFISVSVTNTTAGVTIPPGSSNVTVAAVTLGISVYPGSASVQESTSTTFTPTVTCKTSAGGPCTISSAVVWTLVNNPQIGSLSQQGVYTAGVTGLSTSVVATATACIAVLPTTCTNLSITVTPITISISPTTVATALTSGKTQQFTATVSGAPTSSVRWSLSAGAGTISSTGLYTAPSPITSAQGVTVKVCSTVNTLRCATATLNLATSPDFGLIVTPVPSSAIVIGGTASYTISLSPQNGFTGVVQLTTGTLPAGVTATLTAGSINGTMVVTLTLPTAYLATTAIGTFQITLTGTGTIAGIPVSHMFAVPLTINHTSCHV